MRRTKVGLKGVQIRQCTVDIPFPLSTTNPVSHSLSFLEKHWNSENRSVNGLVMKGRGMRDHSKKDPSLKCERCKKTFCLNTSLQRHKRIRGRACVEKGEGHKMPSEQPAPCPHCNVMLARPSVVKRHIELVHMKRPSASYRKKSHKCMHCEFYTLHEKNLTKHKELMHPGITCEDGVKAKQLNKVKQPGEGLYHPLTEAPLLETQEARTEKCPPQTSYSQNIEAAKEEQNFQQPGIYNLTHVDDENKEVSSNRSQNKEIKLMLKMKTAKTYQGHGQVDLEVSGWHFKCVVCDRNFNNMELLKHHIVTHFSRELNKLVSHQKPFTCPECGKQSLNKANLVKHLCWVHRKFEELTGLSEEDIKPCQLYKLVSSGLQHVTDEFEDEDIATRMSLQIVKVQKENTSFSNNREEINDQENNDEKEIHGKSQRKFHPKMYKESKENTKKSNNQPEIFEMQSNFKGVKHMVKVTRKELTEETENSITIEEQTEAVVNNQYLGLCNICQAILLSQESFKNHIKEHKEKIGKCSAISY